MAETSNIAKMAEKLSKELFAEFQWERMDPTDTNWPCEDSDKHNAKTHPSDVVFYYEEPYTQARTYINTDLKSYAKGTISTSSVRAAIESLARALSCAEKSNDFKKLFLHDHVSTEICGMLFIYNHDGEYDKDFRSVLSQVSQQKLDIPSKSKIVVLGPSDIFWLSNVRNEIAVMRGGSNEIPDREHCRFYYPHLVRKKNVQLDRAKAATLEMLTAPWIIMSFINPKKQNQKGYVVFLRRRGESIDEFLYLIDYLMHYQILIDNTEVMIKILDPDPNAAAYFSKARTQYVDQAEGGQAMKERLELIKFGQINHVKTSFSEIELGMDR